MYKRQLQQKFQFIIKFLVPIAVKMNSEFLELKRFQQNNELQYSKSLKTQLNLYLSGVENIPPMFEFNPKLQSFEVWKNRIFRLYILFIYCRTRKLKNKNLSRLSAQSEFVLMNVIKHCSLSKEVKITRIK